MRKAIIWMVVLISILISFFVYPLMPEQLATHWNSQGVADGFSGKWSTFLMPIVITAIAVLFTVLPMIDPLKKNIEKFRKYYEYFILILVLFFLVIQGQMLLWNLGYEISPNYVMPVGIGLLFFYIGVLCDHSKRNWFIGIRTPWTLSSEKVWEKTHKLGAVLFKLSGIIAIFGVLSKYVLWFVLVPALLTALITIVYSYVIYKK